MTARHFYRFDPEDPVSEVPNVLRWGYSVTQSAEEGQAGAYEIVVDDPDMELDFVGHRRWIVYDDESVDANEIVVDGMTQAVRVAHKGGDITQPVGRVWTIEVADLNTLWTYRVMTGSDSQFADGQTDVERVEQVIGSEEMSYVDTVTFLSDESPVDMDEADHRGQTPAQILDSCAQETGKNWYLYSTGTIGGDNDISVWYGKDGLETYTSDLSLSNDPADLDMPAVNDGSATTYPIGADTDLRRDYARQYSGAYGEYQGGAAYVVDEATLGIITLSGRDTTHPAPEIKTSARMKRRLRRVLRDHATPDEVIKTTITLPASRVTQLRAGMRVAFKATHEPNYEDFRYLRVMSATYQQIGRRYEVALELQGPGAEVPVVPGGCGSEGEPEAFGGTWTWDIPGGFSTIHHQPTGSVDLTSVLQLATVGSAKVGASGYPSPGSPIYWYLQVDRGGSPSPASISRIICTVSSPPAPDPATYGPTLEASDDGAAWTPIIDRATWTAASIGSDTYNLVIPAAWRDARYFRIRVDDLFISGFWEYTVYDEFSLVPCLP